MTTNDIEYLKTLGFIKTFPDKVDPQAFYMLKKIPHKFLKKLHIEIWEDNNVFVCCTERQNINGFNEDVTIYECRYSPDKIHAIIAWLK